MKAYNELRIKQVATSLEPVLNARGLKRPVKGWLAAMREISGVSLRSLASRLRISFQSVAALEKAEAEDRVTLKKLRQAANALDCELVYAIVPKHGTVREFAERSLVQKTNEQVSAVEHSMALEAQSVGNVEEKVREEVAKKLRYGR
ncbi:MAG: helix-turn-helix domain-containing protein [Limisphaerales bacterium]